jgi:hypothetical protein
VSIRQVVNMEDVLEALGLEQPGSDHKIFAPWREDERTASCHIYPDGSWYDYGEGIGGDACDFVKRVYGCTTGRALQWIGMLIDGDPITTSSSNVERKPREVEVIDFRERFEAEQTTTQGMRWLRELCAERWPQMQAEWLIDGYGYGVVATNYTLLIPHWHPDGRMSAVKVRNLSTGEKLAWRGSTYHQLYGWRCPQAPGPNFRPVLLVEGESDCWTAKNVLRGDATVLALPSGAGTIRKEWLEPLKGRRVFVCFDNDAAGASARARVDEFYPEPLDDHIWTPGYKDISDALKDGWDLRGEMGL